MVAKLQNGFHYVTFVPYQARYCIFLNNCCSGQCPGIVTYTNSVVDVWHDIISVYILLAINIYFGSEFLSDEHDCHDVKVNPTTIICWILH